jgi:Calcineurin-like phosphoesterase
MPAANQEFAEGLLPQGAQGYGGHRERRDLSKKDAILVKRYATRRRFSDFAKFVTLPVGPQACIILPMLAISRASLLFFALLFFAFVAVTAQAQQSWTFAVSGDSRNCGDVIMPAIAAGIHKDHAAFYWHLGDFRAIYDFDQDYKQLSTAPTLIIDYEKNAWDDFIQSQLEPFADTTVYLAIGNHELIPPKNRSDYLIQFADWLDTPQIREQRLRDNAKDHRLHTYYHWQRGGIDFITLDSSSADQFDSEQMAWFERVLAADSKDSGIATLVVGMHEALPDSIASDHSMNASAQAEASGRRAYGDLLKLQQASKKNVYVLASHSHFFMEGIFDTDYWRTHGGVLPGWIVGTAGAVRYTLPPKVGDAKAAKTNVYGYLLATVHSDHTIDFRFHELQESDVPVAIASRFSQDFVHQCFIGNRSN